jgi:hypothetical protein
MKKPVKARAKKRAARSTRRSPRAVKKSGSRPALSGRDLRQLQQMVLRSALAGEPLPGTGEAIRLPDLQFVTRDGKVLLSDKDLSGRPSVSGAGTPLRIISSSTIAREAKSAGDLAYLRFQPAQVDDDGVSVTLSGEMAASSGRRSLGLSSVRLRFRKVDGKWEAVGGPVASAS